MNYSNFFNRTAVALAVFAAMLATKIGASDMIRTVVKDRALCNMLGIGEPEKNPQDYYLFKLLPEDFLTRIAAGDYNRELYPRFADREAWKRIAAIPSKQRFVKQALERADAAVNKPVPQLTYSDFCRYAVDGNRTEYEVRIKGAMAEIGELAFAMCLTGDKDKYMMPLLDRIVFMLERSTWCMPAHCFWTEDGVLKKYSRADLYSCLGGAQLALVYRVLGDELEAEAEGIRERMRDKIYRETIGKVLDPVTTELCHWYHNDSASNWVVWCATNCMIIACSIEDDPVRLAELMEIFLYPVSRYIYFTPDDGFCCEGVSYFAVSGGMLFQALDLFERLVPGAGEKIFADKKLRDIAEFVPKMRFGSRFVCFSDCGPVGKVPYNLLYGCAQRFDSALYRQMYGEEQRIGFEPLNGNSMAYYLRNFFHFVEDDAAAAKAVPGQVLFKDCLGVVHAGKFYLSVKAGNNAEMHNHNDLGHFEICFGDTDAVIDAGTGPYTKANFAEGRYDIWYNSAIGHNAPILDGVMQIWGEQYTSKLDLISGKDGSQTLICDLSKAYPAEAGVKSFIRKATVTPGGVTVHDVIDWNGKEAVINLLTVGKPEKCAEGVLLGGRVLLRGEGISLREIVLQEEKFSAWSGPLYRIKLTTDVKDYKLYFSVK